MVSALTLAQKNQRGSVPLSSILLPASWVAFIAFFLVPLCIWGGLHAWQIGGLIAAVIVLAMATHLITKRAARLSSSQNGGGFNA